MLLIRGIDLVSVTYGIVKTLVNRGLRHVFLKYL